MKFLIVEHEAGRGGQQKIFFVFLFSLFSAFFFGQSTQTIRGKVIEKNTQSPIFYAHVWTVVNENIMETVTDSLGNFVIEKVPVGRREVYAKALGYEDFMASNVLIYSGRETILEIAMIEKVSVLNEVVVRASVDKDLPLNNMATASVRMFSTEEASRYAGAWGDPARMAANFAGVSAANDSRNDIIIRGNSPLGLLWRLDGFDIPNPNHFSITGSSGGAISMINNNQLSNSDFYTGAFPAEFGNAISGVFDLKLRNGNTKKQEFLASIGLNGIELGAEGYFSKKSNASYLINGRYSFLEVLYNWFGMDFGTNGGIPKYRDMSAKINVPLKSGNFSFVTLLGANKIKMEDDMTDETKWKSGEIGNIINESDYQLFFGANYTHRFNSNTRLENRLSYQFYKSKQDVDAVEFQNVKRWKQHANTMSEGRIGWVSSLFHRMNARNFLEAGIGADFFMTSLHNKFYDSIGTPTPLHDIDKNSSLLKLYAQWQHRFNDKIRIIPGFYTHYYVLTHNFSFEPRIGMQWETSPSTAINIGTGLYSQIQPRQVYFYQDANGQLPNKSLKFTDSWQAVAGFSWKFAKSYRLKTEIYYQYLYNVPVIESIPQESILNFDEDFNWLVPFVNKGIGQNYGIELTIEKFLTKQFYFLITSSLYQSTYKGYDKMERNTKFNGNYTLNVLGGYEWKLGKNSLLMANTKIGFMGGKRKLPYLLVTDDFDMRVENDYSQAYVKQYPAYFRWDINLNFKTNFKKWALEFFVELANITNHKNIWRQYYDIKEQKEVYYYHYGFTPIAGVKVYF